MSFERICVLGLGYIGLPTAAVLASRKIHVCGVDTNPAIVETINQGLIHIVEPELDLLVRAAVTEGYLRAAPTVEPADAFIIAVPTPLDANKQPDLGYIEAATDAIAPHLRPGNLIILESTSPVGTTERVSVRLAERRADLSFPQGHNDGADIHIAYCPERVLPGRVLHELVQNDRVVGGLNDISARKAVELYRLFVSGDCLPTGAKLAELCKLTENSFRDVNIAFANEISLICDQHGINVWDLITLANRHPRVNILRPGPGVGGHCIAVDPWFIVSGAPDTARLIETARHVNDDKPKFVVDKVLAEVAKLERAGRARDQIRLGLFGLTFKPDIDDLRESPALEIASALAASGLRDMNIVEPHISALPPSLADHALVTPEVAATESDIYVVLVGHKAFDGLKTLLALARPLVDATGLIVS